MKKKISIVIAALLWAVGTGLSLAGYTFIGSLILVAVAVPAAILMAYFAIGVLRAEIQRVFHKEFGEPVDLVEAQAITAPLAYPYSEQPGSLERIDDSGEVAQIADFQVGVGMEMTSNGPRPVAFLRTLSIDKDEKEHVNAVTMGPMTAFRLAVALNQAGLGIAEMIGEAAEQHQHQHQQEQSHKDAGHATDDRQYL